jgi:hypothetical protein
LGPRDEQPAHGPPLHLVASYPADGQGTDTANDAGVACDTPTPDCAVPTNVEIELRFDRFLLPGAGLGTGLSLYTGDPKANAVGLVASYDLIERVVVFQHDAPLAPNTLYTAEIVPGKNTSQGFWAFDGAPLEARDVPLRFSFTTGSGPAAPVTPPPVTIDDCGSITSEASGGPLSVCSTANCHQNPPAMPPSKVDDYVGSYPPMGLSLTDWGLEHTAINRVAHETATGESATDPGLQTSPRFGVEMNLVDPGFPEKSYLVYKLLRKPGNYTPDGDCPTTFHSPVQDGSCLTPSDDELTALREWFVRGDPMPKEKDAFTPPSPFSRSGLQRVIDWIAAGATCTVQ